ncbi:putative E3 ubiquitin-protein ligase HERC4 [Trichoplax sp. H2]|nr:putative E3 ubiquitin-protein ligase HERC4 [Trichoplax sp. H2]|eukprot:RDD40061.1 putative E3 ubiquitin-protein ligase HERC4 [Trichoplax sp. H2]
MFAWGKAIEGQLGLGGIDENCILKATHVDLTTNHTIKLISCGLNHTILLLQDGQIYSCGSNDYGQTGRQRNNKRFARIDAFESMRITNVSSNGANHNLAINDKNCIYAWGDNSDGQLGVTDQNLKQFYRTPRQIKSLSKFAVVQVACGQSHSLAVINDGTVFSWGSNRYGQLGIDSNVSSVEPKQILKLSGFYIVQIAAGGAHSLAITNSGALLTWGKNSFGQLGLGTNDGVLSPTCVSSLRSQHIAYAACGEDHTAVLTKEGGVFTFGAGSSGQLGHNSLSHHCSPQMVVDLMGIVVTQITCGRRHTLAYARQLGRLYSFGLNGSGQLGNNSCKNATNPTISVNTWKLKAWHIAAGGDHSFLTVSQDEVSLDYTKKNFFDTPLYLSTSTFDTLCRENLTSKDLSLICSSYCCLNGSFPIINGDKWSKNDNGMDLIEARQIMRQISRLPKQILHDLQATLVVTFQPNLNFFHLDQIRFLLLLPEFTSITDTEGKRFFAYNYCKIVYSLPDQLKEVLSKWWSTLGAAYFVHIVNETSRERDMTCCLAVLLLLNKCNESAAIISYTQFYLTEILQYINIEDDYIRWVKNVKGLIFCHYPFLLDTLVKTRLLDLDTKILQQNVMQGIARYNMNQILSVNGTNTTVALVQPFLVLTVKRENLLRDTLEQIIRSSPETFRKPLKIEFVNEDAVDEGGVRKEFFLLIIREIFDPKYGMFQVIEDSNMTWFADKSFEGDLMFRLIGILCGLAIYNATIIDFKFPVALYKKLLNKKVTFEDLASVKPTVARGLQELLDYEGEDVEDTFGLTFQISREYYGSTETIDLTRDGSNVPVTKDNRLEFVNAYVKFELEDSISESFNAFKAGFLQVYGGKVLELFHPEELRALLCGKEYVDFNELEKVTAYQGEFYDGHITIKYFWEIFQELTLDKKKAFLTFLTGTDHVPVTGVTSMKLIFQSVHGADEGKLPVAHTCFNILDLPVYKSKETLRQKLLLAIENSAGFGLV